MTAPEQKARITIDRKLEESGWTVQDYKEMNISANLGVLIREFPLLTGTVDYILYAEGKVIGVAEAKPEGHTLTGVEVQSDKYSKGLKDQIPCYCRPLPFAYESTGVETRFTNGLDPEPRSRDVFTFHRPEELLRLVNLEKQLRGNLQQMPDLDTSRLWKAQKEAITNLENSLAYSRPRALIQMATGSGKTYTACSFAYRLIKFAKAKRILFLVDRNNLGRQTLNEFQQYTSPYTKYRFTEEYNVQHLRRNAVDPACKVVITTIQRLYSILKGEEEFEEEAEEQSMFETGSPFGSEAIPVVYNRSMPIETFDFIVVDECHRSIYNVWRQVVEYFDAFIIGLTATPSNQTLGFFDKNLVQDYSHEKAVADGVNVGYEVYRIRTKVTEQGAKLDGNPGVFVPRRDKRTRKRRYAELDEDLTYTDKDLDRDVVSEDQIRLVIKTFKDRLFTEIFPGRSEVPKTLVFAKTDNHAEDIVKTFREEFGKGNDFCQKITSQTTGKDPQVLLNEFRNSYNPRIAVTVDMIATGTDVRALECLLFMRNIRSAPYFEQMKGRGSRIIGPDDLQAVTPDAEHKSRFVIVDAVGVCESDKSMSKPLNRKPSVSFDQLMQMVAQGIVHPDIVSTVASRLARLQQEMSDKQRKQLEEVAGDVKLGELISGLMSSIDPDRVADEARKKHGLPDSAEPDENQLNEAEQELMAEALKPLHNAALRKTLSDIRASLEQVIDEITEDELLESGFSAKAKEKAKSLIADFHKFLEDNKDEIEAIQVLYSKPHRLGLRFDQVRELAEAIEQPPLSLKHPEQALWKVYEVMEPESVKGKGGNQLVDLIAIVRHALHPEEPIVPVAEEVEQRYQQWLEEQQAAGVTFSGEQRKWLDAIRDHIANSLRIEQDDFDYAPFNQLGGLGRVYQVFGDDFKKILDDLNDKLVA